MPYKGHLPSSMNEELFAQMKKATNLAWKKEYLNIGYQLGYGYDILYNILIARNEQEAERALATGRERNER